MIARSASAVKPVALAVALAVQGLASGACVFDESGVSVPDMADPDSAPERDAPPPLDLGPDLRISQPDMVSPKAEGGPCTRTRHEGPRTSSAPERASSKTVRQAPSSVRCSMTMRQAATWEREMGASIDRCISTAPTVSTVPLSRRRSW